MRKPFYIKILLHCIPHCYTFILTLSYFLLICQCCCKFKTVMDLNLVWDKFIEDFGEMGGNIETAVRWRYERAMVWAFSEKIANLPNVRKEQIGTNNFLIDDNGLAVFARSIRQECKFFIVSCLFGYSLFNLWFFKRNNPNLFIYRFAPIAKKKRKLHFYAHTHTEQVYSTLTAANALENYLE